MAEQTHKRPGAATRITLPPEAKSLAVLFLRLHRDLLGRGAHLAKGPRDAKARKGFQILFEQRALVLAKLFELAPQEARALAEANELIASAPADRKEA